MYKIILWPSANMVETRLSDPVSVDGVARYDAELRSHFDGNRLRAGYAMLIDVAACAIQPQDVIAAFQAHVAACPRAARIAVVTGGSIIRMQVRRVMTQPYMRIFVERADAFAWLNEAPRPALCDLTG